MNTLPTVELPLIEGTLIVDNSMLEQLRCDRLLYYQSLRRRVLATAKAGRNFGSTLHAGWAVRYKRCGADAIKNDDIPFINDAMRQWLQEHPQPADDFRNYNHACTVMDAYNAHYGNEPFHILEADGGRIIERSFLIPFGNVSDIQVAYAGKIDLGIRDNAGNWSHDHKTTFQFGKGFELTMAQDRGQRGYAWALRHILAQPVQGYVIDAVRVRAPRIKDEYTGKAPCDATDFMRIPFYLSDDDIDEWVEDTTHMLEHIIQCARSGVWKRHNWQCVGKYGPCDFIDVCSLPRQARESALASNLFEDNTWSPLNATNGGGE